MDTRPTKIPTPDKVSSPDPEPVAVEFLAAELPEHVRAFLDEQRNSCRSK
jgi:hypothetical protein